jgi:hypothetical protein
MAIQPIMQQAIQAAAAYDLTLQDDLCQPLVA